MVIILKAYLERQAEFLKALAHPTRLLLLDQLADGERCVCELVADTELEQANVSQHLAVLRGQGIVECRRDGPRTLYRLQRPEIAAILAAVDAALTAQLREESAALEAAARQWKQDQGGIPG
ncbi:MAG: winged helix-turn-helix transcriptional regulator [Firmicutes bacterium]|nr:winged helix-turn-helix transcriptional regulator [Bacillota bacterium]